MRMLLKPAWLGNGVSGCGGKGGKETDFLCVVECGAYDGRIVPIPLCFNGVQCVAEVPAWVDGVKPFACGDGCEFGGGGTFDSCGAVGCYVVFMLVLVYARLYPFRGCMHFILP